MIWRARQLTHCVAIVYSAISGLGRHLPIDALKHRKTREQQAVGKILLRRATLAAALIITVTGCVSASKPKEILNLPSGALSAQSNYALMWIKPCNARLLVGGCEDDDGRTAEAKLAIHGSADRINIEALYEEDVGLSASIARVNARELIERRFLQEFKSSLRARALNVVSVAEPAYEGSLPKLATERVVFDDVPTISATQFPLQVKSTTYDFSGVYNRLGVDYLFVLELLRFNIERHFGPTGQPSANPQAVSVVRLSLHERSSGNILFNDFGYKAVMVGDDWNRPPYYQELSDSLTGTLASVIEEVQSTLLKQ